jgi:hypothetical protein
LHKICKKRKKKGEKQPNKNKLDEGKQSNNFKKRKQTNIQKTHLHFLLERSALAKLVLLALVVMGTAWGRQNCFSSLGYGGGIWVRVAGSGQ